MRLEKLRLVNFRSHKETELVFDKLNFIRGLCGSGKSSLGIGMEFLLTGRVTGITDEKGAGSDGLIALGQKELRVAARIGDKLITRTRNHANSSIVIQGDQGMGPAASQAEAWIAEHIGAREVIRACLNSSRFVDMNPADQKALLVSAMAGKPAEIPKDLLKTIAFIYPELAITEVRDAAHAQEIYKYFYDKRTEFNRSLGDFDKLAAPEKDPNLPPLERINDQLILLAAELAALNQKRGALLATHAASKKNTGAESIKKLEAEKTARVAKYAEDIRRLEEAEKIIAEQEKHILNPDELKKCQRESGNKAKAELADKEIVSLQGVLERGKAALAQLKSAKPGKCETCQRPFEVKDNSGEIASLQKTLDEAERNLELANDKRRKLGDPAGSTAKAEAHQKAVVEMAKSEKVVAELEKLPKTCDTSDLDRQIAAFSAVPDDSLFDQPDTTEIDAEIAAMEGRISKGNILAQNALAFANKQQRYEQDLAKRDSAQAKWSAVDQVVKAFAENGPIRALLVGDRFETFKTKIAEVLSRFGFKCELELEQYRFEVDAGAGMLSLKQLSRSQKLRFSIGFQSALAEATGFRFAIFDDIEILTPDIRRQLLEAISIGGLEQVLVLVTDAELAAKENLPPGVKFFDLVLESGKTRIAAEYGGIQCQE